jgi:hypothetical protein
MFYRWKGIVCFCEHTAYSPGQTRAKRPNYVSARSECIQVHAGEHNIVDLCELLAVPKSGYYAWCKRAQSKQKAMNEELSK